MFVVAKCATLTAFCTRLYAAIASFGAHYADRVAGARAGWGSAPPYWAFSALLTFAVDVVLVESRSALANAVTGLVALELGVFKVIAYCAFLAFIVTSVGAWCTRLTAYGAWFGILWLKKFAVANA